MADNPDTPPVRSRRPPNTAFRQQRLKAWQPILTPKTVLPTFFLIGVIFIPIGIALLIAAHGVQEFNVDYTNCDQQTSTPSVAPSNPNVLWSFNNGICTLSMNLPETMPGPVFMYYRLTNFYQNHRRYVKSVSTSQLFGNSITDPNDSSITDCDPLISNGSSIYYPCGLIANSAFTDVLSDLTQQSSGGTFTFSSDNIAWPSDKDKFLPTKYSVDQVVPPRDWQGKMQVGSQIVGTTWASVDQMNLFVSQNQRLMVWMRTAGLPTFRKLWGRLESSLSPGIYTMTIKMNFNVRDFSGTKSVVLATASWIGGKNPFLGIAYVTVGSICLVLGFAFLTRHLVAPRKLGDHTYLSWNQPAAANAH